jgi:hypothetical protein
MFEKVDFNAWIGLQASEPKDRSRLRFRQGLWRAFVLGTSAGPYPVRQTENICNVIRSRRSCARSWQ